MTDNETMRSADNETVKQRVKAIYPHIVVSGDIDKPYYSIHWYDIEKKEMYCGFSSSKLELVRKWLEEEFEVVEADIDNLINRQKAEIERLQGCVKSEDEVKAIMKSTMESMVVEMVKEQFDFAVKMARFAAIKEFAERVDEEVDRTLNENWLFEPQAISSLYSIKHFIKKSKKEMVGES